MASQASQPPSLSGLCSSSSPWQAVPPVFLSFDSPLPAQPVTSETHKSITTPGHLHQAAFQEEAAGWERSWVGPLPPAPHRTLQSPPGTADPVLSAIPTLLCHLSPLGWGMGSSLEPQTDPRLEVFLAHREAERLLEPKPEGCYLVRFSESTVTFVLTYR